MIAARPSVAEDNAWGSLSGRFVTEPAGGEAAEPQGVPGIAVYLEPAKDRKLAIHPKYETEKRRTEERTIEIRDSRFVPGIVFLRTNQPLVVKNADTIEHVATSPKPGESPAFPGILRSGESRRFRFPESGWQSIVCNLHNHPHAYLVIQSHPYGAVTGADGRFVIEDLPVGEHTFRVWRPPTGYIRQAKLAGTPVEWKRGLARFTIRPGPNDLGEIQIPSDSEPP
ncbi:MAG: carboxypeptidase regulatory-like domain-containing protein [Pirellulales bacterium]